MTQAVDFAALRQRLDAEEVRRQQSFNGTHPRGAVIPAPEGWPEPPGAPAFRGLAGKVVCTIEPYTEADPVALLTSFLTAASNAIGSGPHTLVGATRHTARLFTTIVGKSSKARKGDSWQPIRTVMSIATPDWSRRVLGGLASGEGLIWAVRDSIEKNTPVKERGVITGYQREVVDEGVSDKRLFVLESEFARVLKVMGRQGNVLSPVLREAWDSGDLSNLTKNSPATATGAHVSLLCHVTTDELREEFPDLTAANGFANRFGWYLVRRTKELPSPRPFTGAVVESLADEVAEMLEEASTIDLVTRDADAEEAWCEMYHGLSAERDGLAGAILGRAEAQVTRLSLLYALLDGSSTISAHHLAAAVELWAYAEQSVEYIFADATGDHLADTILPELRQRGSMTRTEVSGLLGRNVQSDRIARALQRLETLGKARHERRETGGRAVEVWTAY